MARIIDFKRPTTSPSIEDRVATILSTLAHEHAVALEMNWTAEEIGELWEESVDAMLAVRALLHEQGLPVPGVVEHLLHKVTQAITQ